MEWSRRKFTKEFKEEAVRRRDLGVSLAEVARACEVNPNVLHRWRRELRDYGVKASPGTARAALKRAGWRSWSGKSAAKLWRSIFCGDAWSMSRSSGKSTRGSSTRTWKKK
jgi:transposase